MTKKIAVIMSIYNEKLIDIQKSLESILNQSYKNIEIILILDKPDRKKEISNFIHSYKEDKITMIINEKNIGLALSLNKGIKLTNSEYIARMDADDIMEYNRIETQIKYLEENPEIMLLGTQAFIIDENDKLKGKSNFPINFFDIKSTMESSCCILHPTVIIRKKVFSIIGYYRDFVYSQDYDLFLRILNKKLKMENLSEPLLRYRVSDKNVSTDKALQQFLLSEYIKKLYFERKTKGKDSFSIEKIKKILEVDIKEAEKFKKVKKLLNNSKGNLKKILIYIYGCFYSKYYILIILNKIKYRFMKKWS